jgi:twitching motility protein PilT
MRDYETISLAMTAAETCHLVFATLHANTAAKTIDRMIDVFPTGDKPMARTMLSSSLEGVIAQTLLPRVGGGRVGAFEVLVGTNAVRNLIRENQIPQIFSMIQTGSRYGMITMQEAVNNLLMEGTISQETAEAALAKADDEGLGKNEDVDAAEAAMPTAGGTTFVHADEDGKETGEYSF